MTAQNGHAALSWAADQRVLMLTAEVATLAAGRGHQELARALEHDVAAIAGEPPLNVVVAGKSNSGKSTLLDALHRRRLLADGLRLVEAPGIDNLDRARGALALDLARRADAMLFLLDPEAPPSGPEQRFLEDSAPTLGEVIFVVAKADTALDVEAVASADRRVLGSIAPRWAQAPLYIVSAREKLLADAAMDRALADLSGIPALVEHVRTRLLPHPHVIRSARVIQRCCFVLSQLMEAERRALLTADEAATLAQAAVDEHRAYVERSTNWEAGFTRDYQRHARQVVERELRMRLLERRERRDVSIRSGGVALEEVTAEVKADLTSVAEQIESAFVERIAALVGDWAWRLELDGVHLPSLSPAERAESLTPAADVGSATWHAREVSHGVSGVVNMARSAATGRALAGVLPGGIAMGTGLGIVLTGLSWATSEWLRTKVQDQQGAIAFVQASYARAQIELEAALREHAVSLQPVAHAALQQRVEERRRGLAAQAAGLQQEAERCRSRDEAARAAGARRLAELEAWGDLLDELAERFSSFMRSGSTSPQSRRTPTTSNQGTPTTSNQGSTHAERHTHS
jgi:hypothetical protein